MNVVSNKSDYFVSLQVVITKFYNCRATWRKSVAVQPIYHGKVILEVEAEVFELSGHPKAIRAYGWSRSEGKGNEGEHSVFKSFTLA